MIDRRGQLGQHIEEYHGIGLDRVLAEIEYLRDVGDTVIGGGSLAYGLGNRLSDLDVVIAGPTTVQSSPIPVEHFLGSLRVDVWKLSQELIEQSFRRAEEALTDEAELLGAFGDSYHEDEFKLLHRIVFGVVIDGPELELQALDCRAVASDLVTREYLERMRASALVAQLAQRAGRPIATVFNARLAVENALNAAIPRHGLPFCGDKWLGERLDAELPELADLYRPFRRLPADPFVEGEAFVEAAIAACTEVWGLDLGLEALAELSRWHNGDDVRLVKIGGECLLLAPRAGALWELEESEAEAWRRLRATDGDGWRLADCGPEGLMLCVQLYEHGLLDLRWSEGLPIARLDPGREARV